MIPAPMSVWISPKLLTAVPRKIASRSDLIIFATYEIVGSKGKFSWSNRNHLTLAYSDRYPMNRSEDLLSHPVEALLSSFLQVNLGTTILTYDNRPPFSPWSV